MLQVLWGFEQVSLLRCHLANLLVVLQVTYILSQQLLGDPAAVYLTEPLWICMPVKVNH